MALNNTGLPQPGDYILGRGIVYAATLSSGVPDANGWRDLGNSPEFTVSLETEKLEHQSSRAGLQTVDKEVTLSQKMNIAFSLDEFNDQNLALFMQGETATHTNAADGAAITDEVLSSSVVLGRWYDLVNASGDRLYDVQIGDLVVEEGSPTTLVLDTDFTLDAKMGRIFILSSAVNITDGEVLQFSYTDTDSPSPVASTDEVRGLTAGNVQVAIKFIAENPASSNKRREYQFHTVTLSPEGDMALIGNEFATMGFTGAVESNTVADADAPYVRIRDHAAS